MKKTISLMAALLLLPGVYSCNNDNNNQSQQQQDNTDKDSKTDDNTDDDNTDDDNTDDDNTDDDNTDDDNTDDDNTDDDNTDDDNTDDDNTDDDSTDDDSTDDDSTDDDSTDDDSTDDDSTDDDSKTDDEGEDIAALFAEACKKVTTQGAMCLEIGNDSWFLACQNGTVNTDVTENCSNFNMSCGKISYNNQNFVSCLCSNDTQCKQYNPAPDASMTEICYKVDTTNNASVCDFDCASGYDYAAIDATSNYFCAKDSTSTLETACKNPPYNNTFCVSFGEESWVNACNNDHTIAADYTQNCSALGMSCITLTSSYGYSAECSCTTDDQCLGYRGEIQNGAPKCSFFNGKNYGYCDATCELGFHVEYDEMDRPFCNKDLEIPEDLANVCKEAVDYTVLCLTSEVTNQVWQLLCFDKEVYQSEEYSFNCTEVGGVCGEEDKYGDVYCVAP